MAYRSYQGFRLTPIWAIIGLNLLFFIATLIAPALIRLLGLQPGDFPDRSWTILTSMFMHGGFGHIFANMLTLYFFGRFLSRLVGDGRFLAVYFGGGILGNILLLLLASFAPLSVAIGASGAVFALGGALTFLVPRLRVFIFPIPVPIPLWVAVIGGFVILSFLPFIAWQAHLGGLIVGLIAGYFFRRSRRYYY